MATQEKSKTFVADKKDGGKFITGVATQAEPKHEQPTIQDMDRAILNEKAKGEFEKARLVNKSWHKPGEATQFVVGQDSGTLSWLTPLFCTYFACGDVGYKKKLRIWNFPPSIDGGKKKHEVMRQYYKKINDKYILVDAFDANTPISKINLIKAWLESLGYAYTYILGTDFEELANDEVKFADTIFGERLKPLNPKAKDYPKFKIPQTYQEAGMH